MRPLALLLAILMTFALGPPATAQGLFAPVARINDRVITGWELDQRMRFNRLLGAQGDLRRVSMDQLIDDRLRLQAAASIGALPSDADIIDGLVEFAGRANLSVDQFHQIIEANGVDRATFRDFVTAGVAWRNVVRERLGPEVSDVDPGEIRRTIRTGGGAEGGVRVLMSEIILPARNAQERAIANARAAEIRAIDTFARFESAASRYSVSPTRQGGGRLEWLPIEGLPAPLRGPAASMSEGQIVGPIDLGESIGWFQLRKRESGAAAAARGNSIEYATVIVPGGTVEAANIAARADRCDDLYSVAPGRQIDRVTQPIAQIPQAIAAELSRLDENEASYGLTQGASTVLVMLCTRAPYLQGEDAPVVGQRAALGAIRNERLERLAAGYLAELRSGARIQYY